MDVLSLLSSLWGNPSPPPHNVTPRGRLFEPCHLLLQALHVANLTWHQSGNGGQLRVSPPTPRRHSQINTHMWQFEKHTDLASSWPLRWTVHLFSSCPEKAYVTCWGGVPVYLECIRVPASRKSPMRWTKNKPKCRQRQTRVKPSCSFIKYYCL